jgi:hypothetical protein
VSRAIAIMNTTHSAMPTLLKVVIGFFALSIAWDLYLVVNGAAGTAQWIRMAIGIGVIVGLVRGSESTRAIVRALSVLGMLGGTLTLLQMVPLLGALPASLMIFGLGAALLAVLGSLFSFWALGREDVEMWMARRSFGAS